MSANKFDAFAISDANYDPLTPLSFLKVKSTYVGALAYKSPKLCFTLDGFICEIPLNEINKKNTIKTLIMCITVVTLFWLLQY